MVRYLQVHDDLVDSVEIQALDLTGFGLFMWLSITSWKTGGVPDDQELIRRAIGSKASDGAFAGAWKMVRPLLDQDTDGKLRVPWVEGQRVAYLKALKSDRERKREGLKGPRDSDGIRRNPTESDGFQKIPPDSTVIGEERRGKEKARVRAQGTSPWSQVLAELGLDPAAWDPLCVEWAAARAGAGHKALKAHGWRCLLRDWGPRGAAVFQAAVRYSASQGYQGLFAPNGSMPSVPATDRARKVNPS